MRDRDLEAMTAGIRRARDVAGGTVALAEALGVSAPTVSEWVVGKRKVPLERCPAIEHFTGVPRGEIRPDIDWAMFTAPGSGPPQPQHAGESRRGRRQMG